MAGEGERVNYNIALDMSGVLKDEVSSITFTYWLRMTQGLFKNFP